MLSLIFEMPGMSDVEPYYLTWMKEMESFGIVGAYKQEGGFDQYPPLVAISAHAFRQIFDISYLLAWKLGGSLSLLSTTLICHQITKTKWLSQAPIFFMGIPTIFYGYADIQLAPFLFISLSLILKEKYFYSGISFALSCLFKWQPIILFPAIVIYMFLKKLKKQSILFSLGAASVAVLVVVTYGWYNPAKSLWLSSLNHYFSAWGPNLYWIVTGLLSTYFPQSLPGLGIWGGGPGPDGYFSSLKGDPKQGLFIFAKIAFYFVYLLQISLYILKTSVTEINILRLATASALVYWQFSTGVHANHIFFLMPLAIVLSWKVKRYWMPFSMLFILVNLNLYRVLGYDGVGSGAWPDEISGINISILLSLAAVALTFYLISILLRDSISDK